MTHSYSNGTAAPIGVVFCTSSEHHADGTHPDPDQDEVTVTVAPGSRLTFSEDEGNSANILAQVTNMTEV